MKILVAKHTFMHIIYIYIYVWRQKTGDHDPLAAKGLRTCFPGKYAFFGSHVANHMVFLWISNATCCDTKTAPSIERAGAHVASLEASNTECIASTLFTSLARISRIAQTRIVDADPNAFSTALIVRRTVMTDVQARNGRGNRTEDEHSQGGKEKRYLSLLSQRLLSDVCGDECFRKYSEKFIPWKCIMADFYTGKSVFFGHGIAPS
jgi:hypothetical protein